MSYLYSNYLLCLTAIAHRWMDELAAEPVFVPWRGLLFLFSYPGGLLPSCEREVILMGPAAFFLFCGEYYTALTLNEQPNFLSINIHAVVGLCHFIHSLPLPFALGHCDATTWMRICFFLSFSIFSLFSLSRLIAVISSLARSSLPDDHLSLSTCFFRIEFLLPCLSFLVLFVPTPASFWIGADTRRQIIYWHNPSSPLPLW